MIAAKLGAENTTVVLSCVQFYTNISDMYTEHATQQNSAKLYLSAINLEINS